MPVLAWMNGLRVLLVEDQSLLALAIEEILGELGCVIVGYAPNLSRAYRLLDRVAFDVAVLDINLGRDEPVYGFADELAARAVPFCFLTAYKIEDVEARFAGVPIVSKPLDAGRLTAVLMAMAPKG